MSYDEISLKAEIVAKALDDFEKDLTAAIMDSSMSAVKERHRSIRHRVRNVRDEIREELVDPWST